MRAFLNSRLIKILVATLLVISVGGCGSSNNDQGVAFTLLGFFDEEASSCDDATGLISFSVPMSQAAIEPLPTYLRASAGLNNSLTGQTMRVEYMFYEYEIPGSSLQPPNTNQPVALTLGPFTEDEEEDEGGIGSESSLPEALRGIGNCGFAQVRIVPSSILEWVNLHRNELPEPPFTMLITAYATGMTSAGDRHDTNKVTMFIEFLPDNVIPPTAAPIGGGTVVTPADGDEGEADVDDLGDGLEP